MGQNRLSLHQLGLTLETLYIQTRIDICDTGMLITSSSIELGYILKRMSEYDLKEYSFSMDKFNDRLKLQKMIYLLQSSGVYLGYDFRYYIHGPYCEKLTRIGFEISEIYGDIMVKKDQLFQDKNVEKKYNKTMKLLNELKTPRNLEIAASLHLRHTHDKMNKAKSILDTVQKTGKNFSESECQKIWSTLYSYKLVDKK